MSSDTAAGKPVGRPRGFDRGQALHLALVTFWERGYEGTSVAYLTRRLGIAPPSLYAAFGDKKTLFIEAVDLYYARFVEFLDTALGGSGSARDAISTLLRGVAEFYSNPDQPRGCLVNTTPPPAGDPEAWTYLQSLRNGVRDRLRRRIQIGADAGELPAGTDVDELADVYWNTILGMSMRSRDGATRAELERTAEAIMITWPGQRTPR